MEEKLVSIITPMWKGAGLVGKTIDSVLANHTRYFAGE